MLPAAGWLPFDNRNLSLDFGGPCAGRAVFVGGREGAACCCPDIEERSDVKAFGLESVLRV
jgi:hypothetical protein